MEPKFLHRMSAPMTPREDKTPVRIVVDDAKRLREIRALVQTNNQSELEDDLIICQIYMESRFESNAAAAGSSARGLMQLLKGSVQELYRVENLNKPRSERVPELIALERGARLHASEVLIDDATNIQIGTQYLQLLIDRQRVKGAQDPVVEAYKKYRGLTNGIYYAKISRAAEQLANDPESMQVLREMVK